VTELAPLVTVLVPTRDEAVDIEGCLEAIARQDYPVNRIEVIVIDGTSGDGTAEVARRGLTRWGFHSTSVLDNPAGSTSSNLNLGLARSEGEIVCRVDARTRIERHYVRTCVEILTARADVAVTGGAQVAVVRDRTSRSGGIARALNNRISTGGSPYRRSRSSRTSDTVYLGAFRRGDLVAVGGWDEALPTNQDFDLNRRMREHGEVWFEASLRSDYLPRSTLGQLGRQYHRFGRAKVRYWRHSGDRPGLRQRLIIAGPLAGLGLGSLVLARRPASLVPMLLAGGAVLVAVDQVGHDRPASPPVRAWSAVATVVVSTGWWTGVAREALVGTQ
jgi:glycosyltransferase involved in cell wall biosynthesis